MPINPVLPSTPSGITNAVKVLDSENSSKASAADKRSIIPVTEAAVYEASGQETNNTKLTYTRDSTKLSEISKQVDLKLSSLQGIVENLVAMQSLKTGESKGLSYDQIMKKYDGRLKAFYQNLQVNDSTRLNAQQEISEDGFWGVKQTSERAIEFAKALAGGDPSKVALLKDAIEKGYKAAEKAWGGGLPEICKLTQKAILKGLDDWANETMHPAENDKADG
ncbi:hypothetical protein [Desulfosporosinus youngiae]|uniref:DUF5610 domain-containing protein n=1 Tax=Desulfosporosinus youngiae DSM 17734 TaxID=768710 RepID=H5Y5G4_9FIRM|nr:hypothetical protein [Desulfosporosinus youngiae]EHQ90414.1 hypothetical protein DesyoDRAFT_3390 [Desulfosporosinus youngiae DSM 17734]